MLPSHPDLMGDHGHGMMIHPHQLIHHHQLQHHNGLGHPHQLTQAHINAMNAAALNAAIMGNSLGMNPQLGGHGLVQVVAIDTKQRRSRIRYGWHVMYEALLRYGEQHGHCNVPRRYVCDLPEGTLSPDGKDVLRGQLGSWLTTQRVERCNGKLKSDRLQLLQQLVDDGKLDWSPENYLKKSESSWPYMYECLVDYCEHRLMETPGQEVTSIPEKKRWIHPRDGAEVGLGRWMHTQNKRRRAGKLRLDRVAKIQELVDAGKFKWPQARPAKRTYNRAMNNDMNNQGNLLNLSMTGPNLLGPIDMHQTISLMPQVNGIPGITMMHHAGGQPISYAMIHKSQDDNKSMQQQQQQQLQQLQHMQQMHNNNINNNNINNNNQQQHGQLPGDHSHSDDSDADDDDGSDDGRHQHHHHHHIHNMNNNNNNTNNDNNNNGNNNNNNNNNNNGSGNNSNNNSTSMHMMGGHGMDHLNMPLGLTVPLGLHMHQSPILVRHDQIINTIPMSQMHMMHDGRLREVDSLDPGSQGLSDVMIPANFMISPHGSTGLHGGLVINDLSDFSGHIALQQQQQQQQLEQSMNNGDLLSDSGFEEHRRKMMRSNNNNNNNNNSNSNNSNNNSSNNNSNNSNSNSNDNDASI